jgi:hypothetical protein
MSGDNAFLHELELNVRAELTLAGGGRPPGEAVAAPTEEWLFEEEDAERYQIGLRGLLGAIEGLEDDSGPGVDPA